LSWPAFVAALIGLPVVAVLLQRVANIRDAEIIDGANGRSVFVTLGHTTDDRGVSTARKVIWQQAAQGPLVHADVRLLMVASPVTLQSGELRVAGSDCVYRTAPRARLINGDYLSFKRAGSCQTQTGGWQELELTIVFRGEGRIGLATHLVQPGNVAGDWMLLVPPDAGSTLPVPVVRGRYADDLGGHQPRRIELLAYVWSASSSWWIWLAVFIALVLVSAGVALIDAPSVAIAPASLAVGGIALGVALLYVVVVPPLQAPDEPDHVLAFAGVAERPRLVDSLEALARRGHFDRIHFRVAEKFRPVDMSEPASVAWDSNVFGHDVKGRSVTAWRWWKLLAPVAGTRTAADAILIVRVANAVLFAFIMAAAAALLRGATDSSIDAPHNITLALLLIPTLPFFATHVSEFAVLVSSYILLAAVITAMVLDGERAHLLGLPIGLAAAGIFGGGRSALPFLPVIASVVVGRALMGSAQSDDGRRQKPLIFWGGLAIGLAAFPLLSTREFREGLWPGDAYELPPWFQSAAELFRRNPWVLCALAPFGLAGEHAMAWSRRRIRGGGRRLRSMVVAGCVAIALALSANLLISTLVQLPTVPPIEMTPVTSARQYTYDIMKVLTTSFRLAGHDRLLSSSFWGGFGWLETALPGPVVSVPIVLTTVAIFALLRRIAGAASTRPAVWLVLLGGGWLVSAAVYAIANFFLHRNLHGRYLIGLFVSAMFVAWSGVAWRRAPSESPKPYPFVVFPGRWIIFAAAAIHSFALASILLRYF
jgi:hypothetical protein